ncbi:MAG: hypothetical protein IKF77_06450 [Thermoguttaceae bacterium]|nr:hypothetical protein [Thermoguttaceae bacterium]MBR3219545.1 hypothetical protein [Thermoguttaceae bacterium]
MNTAKMKELVQKVIAKTEVARDEAVKFAKKIGPAALVLLKAAKFGALITLFGAAWCLCRLVFLFQSWTERIRLRERACAGFEAMLRKMREGISKIEELFGRDWKQIFTVSNIES